MSGIQGLRVNYSEVDELVDVLKKKNLVSDADFSAEFVEKKTVRDQLKAAKKVVIDAKK